MRRTIRPATVARRTGWLLCVGIVVSTALPAARSQSTPTTQPASTTQPSTSQPAKPKQTRVETVNDVLHRLHDKVVPEIPRKDIAWRTGLDFCRAVGEARGPRAGALTDAVGYQALPVEGELPEDPLPRTPRRTMALNINARRKAPVGNLPAEQFRIMTRDELAQWFPAVATWMLVSDYAVLVEPPASPLENWVTQRACVVIRIRNLKPSIVGGNLLQALEPAARDDAPRG